MRFTKIALTIFGSLTMIGTAVAQDVAPGLQDLLGAKGRDGEYQMERRGYNFIRTEKSGSDAYSYWQESENGQCVVVRTSDGRYASIVYAPAFDCQSGGSAHDDKKYDRKDHFDTVCGVMFGGEDYSYRCEVTDFYQGGNLYRTTLEFPDQVLRMMWKPNNEVLLHFEGMNPQHARYSRSEGETNFQFEGKTYYYFSDKGRARSEVQNFRD